MNLQQAIGDPRLPPGLYDDVGIICEECGDSRQMEISTAEPSSHFAPLMESIGATDDDLRQWVPLSPGAIILPIERWQDLVVQNGRWVLVDRDDEA